MLTVGHESWGLLNVTFPWTASHLLVHPSKKQLLLSCRESVCVDSG